MLPLSSDQFVSLIVKTKPRVLGFVATMLPRRDQCEEVVQNAFVTAWNKYDQFRFSEEAPDEEFVRWICTIAKFEALAYRRKMSSHSMQFNYKLISKLADVQMDRQNEIKSKLEALSFCVEELTDKDKELVRKRYSQGLTAKQIALENDVTRQSVSNWLVKIRAVLSVCIKARIAAEGGAV